MSKTTTFANLDDHHEAMATWHVVDASEHVLGRMASVIAEVLMGKHKPIYTPHMNVGDGVIVINAGQVQTTGQKRERRIYTRYTGYVGGLRERSLGAFLEHDPELLIKNAVRRMLPKNRLGKEMIARLKVYAGAEHPHAAQKPQPLQHPKLQSKKA